MPKMKLTTPRVLANSKTQAAGDVIEVSQATADRMHASGQAEWMTDAEAKKSMERNAKALKAKAVAKEKATAEPATETAD